MTALLALLIMFVAFMLLVIVFGGEVFNKVWRIQRKRRAARLARYNPRNIWNKMRNKQQYEVELPTVRDFILTLQLSLSLAETLAGALQQAAKQFADRGTFGQRLAIRVRSQLQVEPEQVILALAKDFDNEHLFELSERLEIAHEGGLSYAEAVNTTLDDVEEEIRTEVEKEIERAPVMLTIPMIMGVFFPALALLGFPLLVLMFDTMLGATSAGGGVP